VNAAHRLIVLLLGVLVAWLGPLTSVQAAVLGTAVPVPFYVNNGQQHTEPDPVSRTRLVW